MVSAGKLEDGSARVVVILIALIPFFALSGGIDRVLGEGSLAALFLRRRDRRFASTFAQRCKVDARFGDRSTGVR